MQEVLNSDDETETALELEELKDETEIVVNVSKKNNNKKKKGRNKERQKKNQKEYILKNQRFLHSENEL